MGNILYLLIVVLIIAWLIGLVGFNAGGLIHLLLVVAVVILLFKLIGGRRRI